MTDPVADFLTRVRNAIGARQQKVDVPASRLKLDIARILKEEGYISNFKPTEENGQKLVRVYLKYGNNNEAAISNPESRVEAWLPRIRRTYRDPPRTGWIGDQHPDHAQGRDDGTPGAQRRRGRRDPLRSLVEQSVSLSVAQSVSIKD